VTHRPDDQHAPHKNKIGPQFQQRIEIALEVRRPRPEARRLGRSRLENCL
jgi:hypothetical protein